MRSLRRQFLLDPAVTFLNHGSFGATPRPVFKAYQRWQRELERAPVEFLARRAPGLLAKARAVLGAFLGTTRDEVVFMTNATVAVNTVARSLKLGKGDEVLASAHEYGACDRIWQFLAEKHGFQYVRQWVDLPLTTAETFVEEFWQGVSERTKVIFISHVTSPTALVLPVEAICRRARGEGILTLVDGAHAPGQIALNLDESGVDFYAGNLHKWCCAPKGAGFLYARKDAQDLLEPLVVSWGWQSEHPGPSQFVDHHEWQGTRDLSAFLSVPDAIHFLQAHEWEKVGAACHELAGYAQAAVGELTGLPPLNSQEQEWFGQMVSVSLPSQIEPDVFQARLYEEFQIEVPLIGWYGYVLLRISIQGYNHRRDIERLLEAMVALL